MNDKIKDLICKYVLDNYNNLEEFWRNVVLDEFENYLEENEVENIELIMDLISLFNDMSY